MGLEDLNSFADSIAPPQRFRTTLHAVADTNPDEYAAAQKEGRRLGVPPSLLPAGKGDRARLGMQLDPNVQALPRSAPQTARWLENPDNARLAHDDIENLSRTEKWFKEYVGKPAAGFINQIGIGVDMLAFPFAAGADYMRGGDKFKETLSQRIAKFQEQQKAAAPDPETGFSGRLMQSLVGLAPYLAMGPAAPAILAGSATAGKGVDLGEKGVSGPTLSALSALSGATAYGMTKIPFAGKGTGSMTKDMLKGAGRGAVINPILGGAERAAEKGVLNLTGNKDAADGVDPLDPGAVSEDLALGILFGAHGGYEGRKAHAQQETAAMIAVAQMFKESKVRQRDSETFRDHVDKVAAESGLDHVGMPVEKFEEFFQSIGKRPEDLLTDPNSYYEAKATGSDVIIPMGDFAANISEHITDEHAKDIRRTPGADTLREIEEAQGAEEKAAEEFRATVENADNESEQAPERRVYDDVLGQLIGLHIPRDVAEKQASLWAIRARTRGVRLDMDPWALYQEKPLEVVRDQQPEQRSPIQENTTVRPAVMVGDEIKTGADGERHTDIVKDAPEKSRGFLTPDGKFVGRPAASKWLEKNRPDLHGKLSGEAKKKLHSEDLWRALADGRDLNQSAPTMEPDRVVTIDQTPRIEPLHEVRDKKKLAAIVADMRTNGYRGRPILVFNDGEMDWALTGSHRLAAAKEAGVGVSVVEVDSAKLSEWFDDHGVEDLRGMGDEDRADLFKSVGDNRAQSLADFEVDNNYKLDMVLNQPGDDKRGYIKIGAQKIQIGLMEKADLSTFIHETGHAFTEEMAADAMRENAPQQIKDDWETLKRWAGVEGDTISTEAHEKIATGFEAYMQEGKAPSQELMPLFQRFSAWIKQVYRKMSGLGVKLPPEVRDVMDRMLATDDEIARAEDLANLRPLFATAADAGMTEAEFNVYRKVAEKAHAEHSRRLMSRLMSEVSREQKQWWKDERAKVMDEVTAEAQESPAYKAFQALTEGKTFTGEDLAAPIKLDREALVKAYGEEFVKKLPRAFHRMYAKEGGVHQDIAAEILGFASGDEMIKTMAEAPKMKEWITNETKARMLERYGDIRHDGSMAEEALKAIHGDESGELLRAELKAIERKRKEVDELTSPGRKAAKDAQRDGREKIKSDTPPLDFFKTLAAETVGGKSLRAIRPDIYARGEAKAGREAMDAAAKQDFQAARDAKVQQLTNHYLYMEAVKAQDEAQKIYEYMKKADSKERMGDVGKASQDLLTQIRNILARYEFRKIPFAELDREQSLREWIGEFEKENEDRTGLSSMVDPKVLDENYQQNYRTIPMDELRSVYDSVRAIIHAATEVNKVQVENRRISADLAAEKLIAAPGVASFKPDPYRPTDDTIPRAQKIFAVAKKLNAGLRREEFLFELLDKGTEGPWHDFFWNGYLRSENKRRETLERIHEPLQKAVEGMGEEQKSRLADKSMVHITSLKADLSRNELFSILLNLGNESNEMKMVEGGFMYGGGGKKLTEDGLREILGTFTKADFEAAQTMWDAINTVWPDIVDLQKRWTGLEPAKVEPRKLVTEFGTFEGGYWPVKYDPRGSSFGEKQNDAAQSVQDMTFRYSGKKTQKGHTVERTEASAPILLDWKTVATRHMNDVATDLAYREWVSDAKRLLKREDIKNEMQLRLGKNEYDNMRHWVDSTIARDNWGTPGTAAWENIYRAGYANFTTAVLGANLAGAFADVSITPLMAATRVNWKHLAAGYKEFLSNPRQVNEFIKSKSDWHARIEENVDQSLRNSIDKLAANPGRWSHLMAMTLNMRVAMYHQAANATWIGAYRGAIANGKTDIQAVRIADKVPRMTQHSGDVGSLSALERHPFWKKMLVYAGPVEVAYNAMVNAAHDIRGSKGTDPAAWGKFFAIWFGQSVLWAAVRGKKDHDESWGGFIARHMALGPLEAFPIARDAVGYAEKKIKGERAEMQTMPILSIPKSIADAAGTGMKYAKGDAETKQLVKDLNIAAGFTTGYPAFQVDITGSFLYDVLSGNYHPKHAWSPLHDAIYRRKKGDE